MLLFLNKMSKRDMDLDNLHESEALDLDVIATKTKARKSGKGDFPLGADTIQEFLANRSVPDGSNTTLVRIPTVVYNSLPGGSSRWKALQEYLINRYASLIAGRVYDDVYKAIETRTHWDSVKGSPEIAGPLTEAYQTVRGILMDAFRAVYVDVAEGVEMPGLDDFRKEYRQLEKEIVYLKRDYKELRQRFVKESGELQELDKLRSQNSVLLKENSRLNGVISRLKAVDVPLRKHYNELEKRLVLAERWNERYKKAIDMLMHSKLGKKLTGWYDRI